jgi:hypothetical protein
VRGRRHLYVLCMSHAKGGVDTEPDAMKGVQPCPLVINHSAFHDSCPILHLQPCNTFGSTQIAACHQLPRRCRWRGPCLPTILLRPRQPTTSLVSQLFSHTQLNVAIYRSYRCPNCSRIACAIASLRFRHLTFITIFFGPTTNP